MDGRLRYHGLLSVVNVASKKISEEELQELFPEGLFTSLIL